MQWTCALAENMHKASKMCLSQHVLDPILLKQQQGQIFFYCYENYEFFCAITVQMVSKLSMAKSTFSHGKY